MRNAFWPERSESRTVRLQNSITGQPRPLTTSVSPNATGLGLALTRCLAAAPGTSGPAAHRATSKTATQRTRGTRGS